eukprot:5206730-Prymnesium_polylepis.1
MADVYAFAFARRCASLMLAHLSSPIFSLAAASAASTMRRFIFSAVAHVSPMITVFSASLCIPSDSGSGIPAAAQLPTPCLSSCTFFQPEMRCCPCTIMSLMSFAIASAVPPAVSVQPRCTTSTRVPGASSGSICVLDDRIWSSYLDDSSTPKEMTRSDLATRTFAMHSPATVSSIRRVRSCRSVGSEYSTSGAKLRSTSREALLLLRLIAQQLPQLDAVALDEARDREERGRGFPPLLDRLVLGGEVVLQLHVAKRAHLPTRPREEVDGLPDLVHVEG